MNNHYHLVVETPKAILVAGMAWLQGTYTIRLATRLHLGTPQSASVRLLTGTRQKASADPAQRTLVNQAMGKALSPNPWLAPFLSCHHLSMGCVQVLKSIGCPV